MEGVTFFVVVAAVFIGLMLLVLACQYLKPNHRTSRTSPHGSPSAEHGTVFYTRGSGNSGDCNSMFKDIPYCRPGFPIYKEPPPPYLSQEEVKMLQFWYRNYRNVNEVDEEESPNISSSNDNQSSQAQGRPQSQTRDMTPSGQSHGQPSTCVASQPDRNGINNTSFVGDELPV